MAGGIPIGLLKLELKNRINHNRHHAIKLDTSAKRGKMSNRLPTAKRGKRVLAGSRIVRVLPLIG